ncbi:tRNA (guanosine(46)-N7)-methyltransferase TrmB [Mesomycoplasma conjunctivae]|uniref:tRNA (guanosine(46)-N7)-methyltransferase TrmB n=1 Tax=Mesomycoplasma conjunctivae TaxID=45361 RepID=UPI003DA3922D
MRLKNIPDAKERLEKSGLLIKKPINLNTNWIIEVGMGKGEMLTQMAYQNPNLNFLGIEKFPSAAVKAIKFAKTFKLQNFYILVEDITKILEISNGKVDQIWLTFSDPWPKKKHAKRRLTHKNYLEIYKQLLTKDGKLRLKTDNDQFFEFSKESLLENGWKILYETIDIQQSYFAQTNIQTGYEKKWSQKNKNINYLEATFKSVNS